MRKIILLGVIGVWACKGSDSICETKSDQTAGLVVRVLDKNYLAYTKEQGEDLGRFGIRISTSEQYKRVFSYCCASRLDSIDFTQFEIIGLSTVNVGTNSSYLRDVQRNDAAKKITYTITERYCQRSSPVGGQGNFVVIPKQPGDYTVEFVRNQ